MLVLVGWMPKSTRLNEINLSYILKKDGASLERLYSLCSDSDVCASFILIEDSDGHVFGGYLNQAFMNSSKYYGSGESFVFSIRPKLEVYRWSHSQGCCSSDTDPSSDRKDNSSSNSSSAGTAATEDSNINNDINSSAPHNRGENNKSGHIDVTGHDAEMFVLSDTEQLLMGGGAGFAFRLDDELRHGYSQFSSTFMNKVLTKAEFFTCVNAEVWTVTPAPVIIPLPPLCDPPKTPKPCVDVPDIVLTKK
jgi:hypothetical protein